ncbi:hypothetical protein DVH26_03935 [Paenibacillus sp. H1-7]|nr:hypothetical protein DVH26_03935 [Paenibacillus sp. H1-7]
MPEGGRDMAWCYTMERTGRAEESRRGAKRWIVWKCGRGEVRGLAAMDHAGRRERHSELLHDGTYRKGGRVEEWCRVMDRAGSEEEARRGAE